MDSYTTTTPPPPWLPALAGHHKQQLLHDSTPASALPFHSSPPPSAHHRLLLRAARRVTSNKRRPRPSRRQPTTYITADPASFRRMVHQVTGADAPPAEPDAAELLLARRLPPGALVLPTLDTSASLAGAISRTPAEGGGFPTLESWDHALF
jgi:hypothetical protein